jgi:hypothetical protein
LRLHGGFAQSIAGLRPTELVSAGCTRPVFDKVPIWTEEMS